MSFDGLSIAVLIPCYNEQNTIVSVVERFRALLPDAMIYVYDNNSTDRTAEVARSCGAIVRRERLPGKGNVVRRMFADVEADVYVLVDGDATYDPTVAPGCIGRLLSEQLDMINVSREANGEGSFRPGHRFGNMVLTKAVAWFFGNRSSDILSGYRIMSRRFVKSFPALARGFEIESELTVHALELRAPIAEMSAPYFERPPGSVSKLNTYRDGIRILKTILILVKEERPLAFFSALFAILSVAAIVLMIPIVNTYLATGLVPRFPTAILASSMMLLAFLSLVCGLILDTVTRGRREMKRLHYLSLPLVQLRGAERRDRTELPALKVAD